MDNIKTKTISLFLLATLVSCGGSNSSSSHMSQEDTISNPATINDTFDIDISVRKKVEFSPDFSNFQEFKDNINNYVIIFSPTSKALDNADITCKKIIFSQKAQTITGKIDAFSRKTTVDLNIDSDEPHEVNFICDVSLNDITVVRHKGRLLKSIVVANDKNWSSLIGSEAELDTLVIENDSLLYNRNINVDLKVNKLISNNGRIATFPSGFEDITLDDHNGLSGGTIKINAIEAYGTIAFELRGLNGGKQTKIPETREPLPRDPKLDGQCPRRVNGDVSNPSLCVGKNGHKGLRGHTGFEGLKGGDSGSLDLTINRNFLELAVYYYPGLGGQGGAGGEGGLGSPGGRGNIVQIIPDREGPVCPMCRTESVNNKRIFPDGKPGPKGDKGNQGPKGQDGIQIDSVIAIGNTKEIINSFWKNY